MPCLIFSFMTYLIDEKMGVKQISIISNYKLIQNKVKLSFDPLNEQMHTEVKLKNL